MKQYPMCQSLSWVTKLTEQMQSVKKNSVRYLGFMDRPRERGTWPWRSWTPAPWKCSCAACSKGKATARASAGSPSILTDVRTVRIKEFYFSGLILFTASSWTFLIEQGKLSNHVWRWEAKSLCQLSSPSGDMCSSPHCREVMLPYVLVQVRIPGLGSWQDLPGKAVCHHGALEKKNTSHHCGWFQKKWFYFLKKVLLM